MKRRADLAAYRRSVLEVTEVREINPWVPLSIFVIGWAMLVRLVYQVAVLDWLVDLTVMGMA